MIGAGRDGVAVDHLSGWSGLQWAVMVVLVMITAGMVAGGVFTAHGGSDWSAADRDLATWIGGFGVLAGLFAQWPVLWSMARHATEFRWAAALCVGVAVWTAAAVYYAAALANVGGVESSSLPRSSWWGRVPAIGAGVLAVGVLIGDGANRMAAGIPVVVGVFVAMVVLGVVCLTISVWSSKQPSHL